MMVNSLETEIRLFNEAIARWAEEERRLAKLNHEIREREKSMSRIFLKYKRIDLTQDYILKSVHTHSSTRVINR